MIVKQCKECYLERQKQSGDEGREERWYERIGDAAAAARGEFSGVLERAGEEKVDERRRSERMLGMRDEDRDGLTDNERDKKSVFWNFRCSGRKVGEGRI